MASLSPSESSSAGSQSASPQPSPRPADQASPTAAPVTPLQLVPQPQFQPIAAASPTTTSAVGITSGFPSGSGNKHLGKTTPRPKGIHTKHLTELERFRVRTLYYDACLPKRRIHEITGYSESQIRTAVRAKSAQIGRRPGRPKKNSVNNNNGNGKTAQQTAAAATAAVAAAAAAQMAPSPHHNDDDADADAQLIQQAESYFAAEEEEEERHSLMALETFNRATSSPFASSQQQQPPPPPHTAVPPPHTAVPPPHTAVPPPQSRPVPGPGPGSGPLRPPPRVGFGDLPREVRLRIWRCFLSVGPSASRWAPAPHREWAVRVVRPSAPPFLELGYSPPEIRLRNPEPWLVYVDRRHVPADVLSRVAREARAVVRERLVPVPVALPAHVPASSNYVGPDANAGAKAGAGAGASAQQQNDGGGGGGGGGGNPPPFVWIDRLRDRCYFFGGTATPDLWEKAGRVAYPALYEDAGPSPA
ncbi:hypothetical protein GGR56DRAFT_675555 [Xylariaceae sp. FL0804]|nr:hypothetical protein GGR56DRAFT_675555 [Xylariaceae sp. FL0804]